MDIYIYIIELIDFFMGDDHEDVSWDIKFMGDSCSLHAVFMDLMPPSNMAGTSPSQVVGFWLVIFDSRISNWLVVGWATPLKNDGLRQLRDD